MEEIKNTHGGKRKGAGRKGQNKKMVSARVDRELASMVKYSGHASKIIELGLILYYKILDKLPVCRQITSAYAKTMKKGDIYECSVDLGHRQSTTVQCKFVKYEAGGVLYGEICRIHESRKQLLGTTIRKRAADCRQYFTYQEISDKMLEKIKSLEQDGYYEKSPVSRAAV